MRKLIISIILICSFGAAFSQAVINRAGPANTVQDARGMWLYNAFLPRYIDTVSANLQKGVDSCGAIIFTYDVKALWFRSCSPKKWIQILPSGSGTGITGWTTGGNDVSARPDSSVLGTTSYDDWHLISNNLKFITFSKDGIADSGINVVPVGIDTVTKQFSYARASGGGGAGWKLTGNSGVTASNFIGTLNNAPLRFKVGNVNAGQIDTAQGNTNFGLHAGDSTLSSASTTFANVNIGEWAGQNGKGGFSRVNIGFRAGQLNIDGSGDVNIGPNAGLNGLHSGANVNIGNNAGRDNQADNNVNVGSNTGLMNIDGGYNFNAGSSAGQENLHGSRRINIGVHANLYGQGDDDYHIGIDNGSGASYSGIFNINIGREGFKSATTAGYSVGVGHYNLQNVTTAVGLAAFGTQAGENIVNADYGAYFGHRANPSVGTLTWSGAFGSHAWVTESNTYAIGSRFGINAAASTSKVVISGSFANATLDVKGSLALPIRDTNINYALTIDDNALNATTAGRTYSLPDYSTVRGRYYTVINSSSGDITVQDVSGGIIGNYTTAITYTIPSNESVTFQAGLTGWKVSGVGGCSNCLPISDTLAMLANYWNKGDTMFLVTGALHYSYDTVTHQYTLYPDTASATVDGVLLKEDFSHFDSAYNVILAGGGGGGGIGGTVSNRYIPYGNGTDVLASSASFITDGLGHVNIGPDVDTTQALQVTNNADGSNVMHLKSSDTHTDLKMTASGTATGGTRLRASGNEFLFINNYNTSATFKSDNKVRFDAYTSAIPLDTTTYKLSVMDASGNIEKMNWPTSAATVPLSGITAPTASNSINAGNHTQSWDWTTLTSVGMYFSSNSNTMGNGSAVINMTTTGTNPSPSSQTSTLVVQNDRDGTSATNIALRLIASNGTNNYPLIATGGNSGFGTTVPTSTLQTIGSISQSITTKTATYTAADDYTILCSTNTFTINLPTAVGIDGRIYIIKNITSGTTITIDGSGGETIDGGATYTLASQYKYVQIQSDGTNWNVTGNN